MLPLSLEDHRKNRYLTVEEFSQQVLKVTPSTYYRLLKGQGNLSTMRTVAAQLGVPPATIAEFIPAPSPTYLAALQTAVERANREGWLDTDPETGLPNGQRVHDPLVDEPAAS
jgi:hypothetical protein